MNEQLIKDTEIFLESLKAQNKNKENTIIYPKMVPRIGNAGCYHYQETIKSKEKLKELENSKSFEYVCKNATISSFASATVELFASFESLIPKTLQIIVKNSETLEDSIIEIANITVMGDPQLINFNGATDATQRGTSLLFKNNQDWIDFAIFGSSPGQGLVFDLVNPNNYSVTISIILGGISGEYEMLGQR